MDRKGYPSDVTDEEWAFVAPYLTLMKEEAPQRIYSLREVFNGLRWIIRAGAPWRFMPSDLQSSPEIAHVNEFGKLVWASGCQVTADWVAELVFVCDGATWIWELVAQYYPNAVQIVDWYHAEDRLKRLVDAVSPSPSQRQAWLANVVESLWQGQVDEVIFACQCLASQHDQARQALTYFSNNSCKQIVAQRLKRSGAQWIVEGALLTAKARAAWLSGHWHSLCQKRASLPLAI